MPVQARKSERHPIRNPEDIVVIRQRVRSMSVNLGFSLVDQTKIVTAASELGRNTLVHGRGGWSQLEEVENGGRSGLRLTFEDQGPGIADVERALQDGFSTGSGLGLGLGGSKRLANEFEIRSAPGQGTKVTITRWKA